MGDSGGFAPSLNTGRAAAIRRSCVEWWGAEIRAPTPKRILAVFLGGGNSAGLLAALSRRAKWERESRIPKNRGRKYAYVAAEKEGRGGATELRQRRRNQTAVDAPTEVWGAAHRVRHRAV